ncbi:MULTISPECIES: winged helix-turn-helix domain-containing protein [unclassified Microbispora]|uniref:winged helix-turn-helix domain-containing protein n=1 Tax=unclassified Microbispora TaxID=2614687 RepID=UPI001603D4C4|nr:MULTISPECIES: winged helix-turn-helix domain-containing protein [unclassified Microbispora]
MSHQNVIDSGVRGYEHGHEPPDPGQGSVLGVLPVPGTGAALMIVGYLVPADTSLDVPARTPRPAAGEASDAVSRTARAAVESAGSAIAGGPPSAATAETPATRERAPGPAWHEFSAVSLPEEDLVLDRTARVVRSGGEEIELTYREFELLDYLTSAPGRVYNRRQLMAAVWDRYDEEGGRTVDVHVLRLRRKLGRHAGRIVTVRNVGYKYQPPRRH